MTDTSAAGANALAAPLPDSELRAQAAALAAADVQVARTESSRAVDGAGQLLTSIGVLGTAAIGGGTTLVRHTGSAGGALLLVSGVLLITAFERAVSTIQARIPGRLGPQSPGWLGVTALFPRGQDTIEARRAVVRHYLDQAREPISRHADETRVVGRGAWRKHRRAGWVAVLIRIALVVGVAGALLAALHI